MDGNVTVANSNRIVVTMKRDGFYYWEDNKEFMELFFRSSKNYFDTMMYETGKYTIYELFKYFHLPLRNPYIFIGWNKDIDPNVGFDWEINDDEVIFRIYCHLLD